MPSTTTDIIDVHTQSPPGTGSGDGDSVAILSGLSKPTHQRTLPTLLLYTETGLRIYDELTTKAADYYLFAAEEEILKKHGDDIIRAMHPRGCSVGESVVELGAGQVVSPIPSSCGGGARLTFAAIAADFNASQSFHIGMQCPDELLSMRF